MKKLFLIPIILVLLFSCKKEDESVLKSAKSGELICIECDYIIELYDTVTYESLQSQIQKEYYSYVTYEFLESIQITRYLEAIYGLDVHMKVEKRECNVIDCSEIENYK